MSGFMWWMGCDNPGQACHDNNIAMDTRSVKGGLAGPSVVSNLWLFRVRGMQVPCRYSDQCHQYAGTLQLFRSVSRVCRYPASIQTSVTGTQVLCNYSSLDIHGPVHYPRPSTLSTELSLQPIQGSVRCPLNYHFNLSKAQYAIH